MMSSRRVVITGMGTISPVGNTVEEAWNSVLNCRSGITSVTRFPVDGYRCQVAGEVKNFDITQVLDVKQANRLDIFCHYAYAAARQAVEQAGLNQDGSYEPERTGVLVSSGIGGIDTTCSQHGKLLEKGPLRISPLCIPMLLSNMAAGFIAISFNMKGPNFGLVSACATGLHSIGESMWIIKRGDADVMLAGGAETGVLPLSLAGFGNMRALTAHNEEPATASRPFDRTRDGFVPAEGAAVLVLEELEHAQKRGARILGEIIGYGTTCDAHHITAPCPDGDGAVRAIRMAMKHAEIKPEDIGYVNAHGTSTPINDVVETHAFKTALGEHAYKVGISSSKGVTGHMLGAAGAFESIVCLKALENQVLPPTANYREPDPECDLDYVPNEMRKASFDIALKVSLGFGGHNAAVLYKR